MKQLIFEHQQTVSAANVQIDAGLVEVVLPTF
jgi:hypothetical protein